MEFGKRHDTTNFFARANLLQSCYGETGVMDLAFSRRIWVRIVYLLCACFTLTLQSLFYSGT